MSARILRPALIVGLFVVSCASPTVTPSPTAIATPAAGPSISAGTDCAAFAPDPAGEFFSPFDVSYDDPTPLDWPTGTLADAGLDESLLNVAADNAGLSTDLQSLLVVRHGKLVFERYFNGSNESEANTIASASKSICPCSRGSPSGRACSRSTRESTNTFRTTWSVGTATSRSKTC